MQLEDKHPYHGVYRPLVYDLQDRNWIPPIEINKLSKCKAIKQKTGYQLLMFFMGKHSLKKFNSNEI